MMVVDSDVFIDYLRHHGPAHAFFESIRGREDILFSAITEVELVAGKENQEAGRRHVLLHFLNLWKKIPVDNRIALLTGDLRRDHDLAVADAIVAATALSHGAELITRNLRDFKKVPNLRVRAPY